MAKLTLTDTSAGYQSLSVKNANNTLIEAAVENTLSRDGTGPNMMNANLDMNSYRITNLPTAVSNSEPLTLAQAASIASVSTAFTQENVGAVLWPRTAAEVSAGVTPTNYQYEPGDVRRYGTNTTPGTTDMTTAIQNAISVAAQGDGTKVRGEGTFLITSTLSVQNDNIDIDIDQIQTKTAITCFKFGTNNTGSDTKVNNVHLKARMLGVASATAVNIENAKNCSFDLRLTTFEYGVYLTPREGTSYGRTERVAFRVNSITVDKPIYCPAPTNQATRYKGVGDLQILDCELQAALTNIHLEQADGVIIANSVLYQDPDVSSGRTHNIYLRECTWVHLSSINAFEAGTYGVELEGCTYVSGADVNIAWSGELTASAGLYIHDDSTNTIPANQHDLSSINVDRCSGEGIVIDGANFLNISASVRACSNNHKIGGGSLDNTYSGVVIKNTDYFSGSFVSTSGGQHKYDLDVSDTNTWGDVRLVSGGAATADVNPDAPNVTVHSNLSRPEYVTTAQTILASETGKTFYLGNASGFACTLPTPVRGLKYKFIVSVNPTTAYTVTTAASANIMFGNLLDIVGEMETITGKNTITFVANTALKGDTLEVECDGTNWHVKARTRADGGITATT